MTIAKYVLCVIILSSIFLAGSACIFTIFYPGCRRRVKKMLLMNILIVGLGIVGLVFLLMAMFAELYKPLSSVFVFAGAIMLTLAIGLVVEFDKQSEKTSDEKVSTEVYFLAPIYEDDNKSKMTVGSDKYVTRSASETEFTCVVDDKLVQKRVDNNYVGHRFGGYYRPQVEVTTYRRKVEHYRWFFKESEDIEKFEIYELLLPEDAVKYDYAFEDGQYFK